MSEKPKTEPPLPAAYKLVPADVVTKLEAEHGEILLVKTALGQVAFRNPRRAEYKRFHQECHNEKRRADAGENLIRTCIVYPTLAEFDDLLERKPGIGSTCANALTEFAGSDGDAEQKKVGTA
jgi:hypothetical protein